MKGRSGQFSEGPEGNTEGSEGVTRPLGPTGPLRAQQERGQHSLVPGVEPVLQAQAHSRSVSGISVPVTDNKYI